MTSSMSIVDLSETAKSAVELLENMLDFKSINVLGKGTYGSVVKVLSNEGAPLAAKIVESRLVNELEVVMWPNLQHQNVLKLVDVVHDIPDVTIFLTDIMHTNLFNRLQCKEFKKDPRAIDKCRIWARQVFSGLAYLHRMRLCHLDLRAENIFLSEEDDRAVVADFSGLSWSDLQRKFCPLPRSLRPPEMLVNKKHVSPKPVDLWSCGLLLANLFLGKGFYACVVKCSLAGQIEAVYQYTNMFQCEAIVARFLSETYSSSTLPPSSIRSFMSLVHRFLEMNPRNRLQAEEALAHPFLRDVRKIKPSQVFLKINKLEPRTEPDGVEDSLVEKSEPFQVKFVEESEEKKVRSDFANMASDGRKLSKWSKCKRRFSQMKFSFTSVPFLKSIKFRKGDRKKLKKTASQQEIKAGKKCPKNGDLL